MMRLKTYQQNSRAVQVALRVGFLVFMMFFVANTLIPAFEDSAISELLELNEQGENEQEQDKKELELNTFSHLFSGDRLTQAESFLINFEPVLHWQDLYGEITTPPPELIFWR